MQGPTALRPTASWLAATWAPAQHPTDRSGFHWPDSGRLGGPGGGGGGARRAASWRGARSPNGGSKGLVCPKKGDHVSVGGAAAGGLPGISAGLLLWRSSWRGGGKGGREGSG